MKYEIWTLVNDGVDEGLVWTKENASDNETLVLP